MRALLGVLFLRTVATIFELIGFIFLFLFFYFLFYIYIYIYIYFLPLTLNTVLNYRESIDSD